MEPTSPERIDRRASDGAQDRPRTRESSRRLPEREQGVLNKLFRDRPIADVATHEPADPRSAPGTTARKRDRALTRAFGLSPAFTHSP